MASATQGSPLAFALLLDIPPTGPGVLGLRRLEEMENMLRARGRL